MAWRSRVPLSLPLVAVLSLSGLAYGQGKAVLEVVPDHIRMGSFYHGADLNVTADMALCDGAVIKLEGEGEDIVLNKKGRFGILWLNVAHVTAKNAPQVYILASSGALGDLCSAQVRRELGLGFEALREKIEFESNAPLDGTEFDEFLRLKKHNGAYRMEDRIDLQPAGADREKLSAVLHVASTIPPGEYKIELYCFRGGSIVERAGAVMSIEQVSLPRLMTGLAREHAGAYGALAVAVAMAAGILMGIVFGSKGKRAH